MGAVIMLESRFDYLQDLQEDEWILNDDLEIEVKTEFVRYLLAVLVEILEILEGGTK